MFIHDIVYTDKIITVAKWYGKRDKQTSEIKQ